MLKLKHALMAGAVALAISGTAGASSTATFTGAVGYPLSYTENSITFTSLYPGGHVHLGDFAPDTIANHNGGCCTDPIQITSTGLFTLSSMDIISDSGPTTFVGSNAATYTVTGTGFVSFGSLFAGVSYVDWNTDFSGSSVIDNVTINAAIPEPETYAMLLAGLGLLGFAARRRQRKLAVA